MIKKYLEIGKIVATQGLGGEFRVQYYCDSADVICSFDRLFMGKDKTEYEVEKARPHKTLAVLKLAGIDTVEQAKTVVGKMLYIDRDEEKYSSFCVIPYDAFGWGAAIRHYGSNGRPRFIDNEIFMPSDSVAISHYADSIVREGFRQVLLVKGDSIDIIRP